MSTDAPALEIDPATLALLRETGIEPAAYLKRRAELAAAKRSPEQEAKIEAEREAVREEIESVNRFYDAHGLWSDGLRPW